MIHAKGCEDVLCGELLNILPAHTPNNLSQQDEVHGSIDVLLAGFFMAILLKQVLQLSMCQRGQTLWTGHFG